MAKLREAYEQWQEWRRKNELAGVDLHVHGKVVMNENLPKVEESSVIRESLDWHMQMEPNLNPVRPPWEDPYAHAFYKDHTPELDRMDEALEELKQAAHETIGKPLGQPIGEVPKPNTITQEHVDGIMKAATVVAETVFGKCTVVTVRLPNGFVLTESSACVDPANYSFKIGKDICLDRIRNKVWELEGYRLQSEVYARARK